MGRLPIMKLLLMAEEARIAQLRPEVEAMFAGRASLTTAIPGMLEVRRLHCAGLCWPVLPYAALCCPVLDNRGQRKPELCCLLLLLPQSSPASPLCKHAGAAAGGFQRGRRQLAAEPPGSGPCCLHGTWGWGERLGNAAVSS